MHKKLKYIIIGLLLMQMLPFQLLGQTPELNEQKYWEYREKLRNDFMIGIGPDMGMSIPANVRDTVSGTLQWTDCTMAHGEYLGILAMEYKILEENLQPTDQTVKELFYALWALNRLDYRAEAYFGGTPSLNGFFMRDDISEDSLNMEVVLEHLNQGLPEHKITNLDSDYMDEIPENNEESLDQAILLISGLGLVIRCVPEEVVYFEDKSVKEFQDFETSLSVEAANIINRIVNYMKEGDSVTVHLDITDPNLYGIEGEKWDFIIKNPVTYEEVLRGPNAYFLSKGFTASKYHLTGMESLTTDTLSDTLTRSIFLLLEDNILPNDQDFKAINLEAMANYWPEGLQEDTAFTDYNARILGPRSKNPSYEWIPMLHQLMFGGENNYLMSQVPPDTTFYNDPAGYYGYLIDIAPPEGPYNYGNGNYPNYEWSSTSRTIQPARRGEMMNGFPGNYDGLDYMLYYNMYTLLFSGSVGIQTQKKEDLSIYPNPFSNKLYVDIQNEDELHYALIGIDGRRIQSGILQSGIIETSSLNDGLYILKISDHKTFTITKKLIKHN